MSLTSNQQTLLKSIDRAIEARDPRLASMFAIFTRLTRAEGPPLTERMARQPNWFVLWLRSAVRWSKGTAAVPIVLVACLLAAIIVIGVTTAGSSSCPPSTTLHQSALGRRAVCQPTAGPGK